jgi:hypothetical protein
MARVQCASRIAILTFHIRERENREDQFSPHGKGGCGVSTF